MLVLMAVFWAWVHVMITGLGYDIHIFFGIPVFWPAEMIFWPPVPLAFAGVYHFTRNYRQWPLLSYIHVASLFAIPVLVYCWMPWFSAILYEFTGFPNQNVKEEWERQVLRYSQFIDIATIPFVFFIIAGQIIFIVNFIAGFIRGKKPSA
ncbi:hypothetical protein [Chitinophaga caseinilytica]|uniref:Uncharacterized protein n=1 Tax=Chitinophaga caseinilytica TaxID=2267521 RepID=A0ABZ2Z6Y4_9BACT